MKNPTHGQQVAFIMWPIIVFDILEFQARFLDMRLLNFFNIYNFVNFNTFFLKIHQLLIRCCCASLSTGRAEAAGGRVEVGPPPCARVPASSSHHSASLLCPPVYRSTEHLVVVSVAGLLAVRSLLACAPCDRISTVVCALVLVRGVAWLLFSALLLLLLDVRMWARGCIGIGSVACIVRGGDACMIRCRCTSLSTGRAEAAGGRVEVGPPPCARVPASSSHHSASLLCPPVYRSTEHLVVVSVAGLLAVRSLLACAPCDRISTVVCALVLVRGVAWLLFSALLLLLLDVRMWARGCIGIGASGVLGYCHFRTRLSYPMPLASRALGMLP